MVLIPVLDDWDVLAALLPRLGLALERAGRRAELLVIDDGSREARRPDLPAVGFVSGSVLRLRRNLGHQRAIAVGLCWIAAHRNRAVTVVMDGDGEDDPADVPRLLEAFAAAEGTATVFAARRRRSESWVFQLGYHAYRVVHRVLVGRPVRIGNFSVLPWDSLRRLVVAPELWNHYAAAVVRGRLPRLELPAHRARRIAGRSSMNLVSLVIHGLSAISVFADVVGVRLLLGSMGAMAVALAVTVAALLWRVPGLSFVIALAFVALHGATLAGLAAFVTLANRGGGSFLPERDALVFVDRVDTVEPREATSR